MGFPVTKGISALQMFRSRKDEDMQMEAYPGVGLPT